LRLFTVDFVAQLQVWQCQGDRLLVFMDMNKHILTSRVSCRLLAMDLHEATHSQWGETEPHIYVRGLEPINTVWHSQDLEVASTLQLSFHKGVGDHRLVLVDILQPILPLVNRNSKWFILTEDASAPQTKAQEQGIFDTWKHRCTTTGWLSALASVSTESSPIQLHQMLFGLCKLWTCKWQRCNKKVNVNVG
jgi:hypothetical protein